MPKRTRTGKIIPSAQDTYADLEKLTMPELHEYAKASGLQERVLVKGKLVYVICQHLKIPHPQDRDLLSFPPLSPSPVPLSVRRRSMRTAPAPAAPPSPTPTPEPATIQPVFPNNGANPLDTRRVPPPEPVPEDELEFLAPIPDRLNMPKLERTPEPEDGARVQFIPANPESLQQTVEMLVAFRKKNDELANQVEALIGASRKMKGAAANVKAALRAEVARRQRAQAYFTYWRQEAPAVEHSVLFPDNENVAVQQHAVTGEYSEVDLPHDVSQLGANPSTGPAVNAATHQGTLSHDNLRNQEEESQVRDELLQEESRSRTEQLSPANSLLRTTNKQLATLPRIHFASKLDVSTRSASPAPAPAIAQARGLKRKLDQIDPVHKRVAMLRKAKPAPESTDSKADKGIKPDGFKLIRNKVVPFKIKKKKSKAGLPKFTRIVHVRMPSMQYWAPFSARFVGKGGIKGRPIHKFIPSHRIGKRLPPAPRNSSWYRESPLSKELTRTRSVSLAPTEVSLAATEVLTPPASPTRAVSRETSGVVTPPASPTRAAASEHEVSLETSKVVTPPASSTRADAFRRQSKEPSTPGSASPHARAPFQRAQNVSPPSPSVRPRPPQLIPPLRPPIITNRFVINAEHRFVARLLPAGDPLRTPPPENAAAAATRRIMPLPRAQASGPAKNHIDEKMFNNRAARKFAKNPMPVGDPFHTPPPEQPRRRPANATENVGGTIRPNAPLAAPTGMAGQRRLTRQNAVLDLQK